MNFEDYDKHILKKYKLALSIAILRNKPQNTTITEYIGILNKNNMEDLDDTVCSEDFNMDPIIETDDVSMNSDTILRDFDNNVDVMNQCQSTNDINNGMHSNNDLCTQTTFCESLDMISKNIPNNHCLDDLIHSTQFDHPYSTFNDEINKDSERDEINNEIKEKLNYYEFSDGICKGSEQCCQFNDAVNIEILKQDIFNDLKNNDWQKCDAFHEEINKKEQKCDEFINGINKDKQKCGELIYDINKDKQKRGEVIYKINNNSKKCDEFKNYTNEHRTKDNEFNEYICKDIQQREDVSETNCTFVDSQLTQTYSLYGLSQNNTHYSETQIEHYDIPMKYIVTSKNEIHNVNNINKDKQLDIDGMKKNSQETNIDDNEENNLEITEESQDVIPFKVLEELSRIKNFLNRRNDNEGLTDSGYRSSQIHSSGRSVYNSNWINQSAYSLLNYIKNCAVIVATEEIANEISQVLGQLIDRLHEKESYPIFLEELLEYVNKLLEDVNKEENYQIQNKDECIYRFILINRSVHIIKYTLDKLADTLQDIQTKLTNKDTCIETDDITVTENLCYIFHIFEILLKRYIKNKDVTSQNSQSSESSIKKSSITDIWRKKWNQNKEVIIAGSCEKKCVLLKCSEVLNKIILGTIEKYSLIAYKALQCYNILQQT